MSKGSLQAIFLGASCWSMVATQQWPEGWSQAQELPSQVCPAQMQMVRPVGTG